MKIDRVIETFSAMAKEAQTLTFITRDRGLQESAIAELDRFLELLESERVERVHQSLEDKANLLLGLQFACRALHAELSMYIALKDDRADDAWNHLVDSQELHSAAVRAHPSLEHVN